MNANDERRKQHANEDKLVKTNHKGGYYTMKKMSIALLAVASGAFIIAIPTYIVQNQNKKNSIGMAEEYSSEKSETSSEEQLEYEEYNDQEN